MQLDIWKDLSRSDKRKLAWGVGGAALVAGAVWYLGRDKPKKKKRDYGIKVNALCNDWQVTDPLKLRSAQEETYNRYLQQGIGDPWTVTGAVVGKIAPQCRRPSPARKPNEMRNPGEAIFFYAAFVDTLCFLVDRNAMTSEQAIAHARQAQGWAINQGVDPEAPELADPACAHQDQGQGGPPPWLDCGPPLVAMQVEGTWECRCPDGRAPELVQQGDVMVPIC